MTDILTDSGEVYILDDKNTNTLIAENVRVINYTRDELLIFFRDSKIAILSSPHREYNLMSGGTSKKKNCKNMYY